MGTRILIILLVFFFSCSPKINTSYYEHEKIASKKPFIGFSDTTILILTGFLSYVIVSQIK